MQIRIDASLAGLTVKELLLKYGISHSLAARLKRLDDGITVNGEHVTVRRILSEGDLLTLATEDLPQDENESLIPHEMPLDIIFEDDDLIAVNKPPDMATHPSIGHFEDTLANGLAYYFAAQGKPFVFRAVNRLDRDTSGVVLVAKSRLSAARLSGLMREGRIRKTYIAVLNGKLPDENGRIETCIRRKNASIILREVCEESADGAKHAITVYETLFSSDNASVVRAEPITGRTHQLRVHFSHLGAPIVGDAFYGTAEDMPTMLDSAVSRQALHAASLKIDFGDRLLELEADLPLDMVRLCNIIKGEKIG
ncbi:MAG: RluA family pseudouridine synthase [Clostridia bacterium]|nr:RluA family pseudouridine synthase [Clostridia bacterium]